MDILAWISMWISTLVWIIENCHPKITNIHVDNRGFLEIHAWICYGFSDQGLQTMTYVIIPKEIRIFSSHSKVNGD